MFDPYRKWLGIPEQFRPPTHYQLLGIGIEERDREVIEAAAIRQSAYVRNFQNGPNGDVAARLLTEIAAARVCLLDATKRAAYDAMIRPATAAGPQRPAAAPPRGPAMPATGAMNPPLGQPGPRPANPAAPPNTAASQRLGGGKPAAGVPLSGVHPRPVGAPASAAPISRPQPKPLNVAGAGAAGNELLDDLLSAQIDAPALNPRRSRRLPLGLIIPIVVMGALVAIVIIISSLLSRPHQADATDGTKQPVTPLTPPISAGVGTSQRLGLSVGTQPPSQSADGPLSAGSSEVASRPSTSAGVADIPAVAGEPAKGTAAGEDDSDDSAGRMIVGDAKQSGKHELASAARPDKATPAAEEKPNPQDAPPAADQAVDLEPRLVLNEEKPFGEIRRLELPTTTCSVLAVTPLTLAAGTDDGHVLLWSLQHPEDFRVLKGFSDAKNPITALEFAPDNQMLLVATADGNIRGVALQDSESRQLVQFSGHSKGVRRMAVFKNGTRVISSGDDRTVRVWTLPEGEQLASFRGFMRSVNCLWMGTDGNHFLATDGRFVGNATINAEKPPRNSKLFPPITSHATLSHNGRFLVYPDGRRLDVRDLQQGKAAAPLPDEKGFVGEACFSPDDNMLVTSNLSDFALTVWDFEPRKKLAILEGHTARVSEIAMSADRLLVVSAGLDNSLRIWRLPVVGTLRDDAYKYMKSSSKSAD